MLDDVALCRDKSLLLSRSDVSVLDSPSPTDKGWTARWVSVARIHHSLSLSLPPPCLLACFSRAFLLSSSRSSANSNRMNYLGPSVEYIEYRRRKVERSPVELNTQECARRTGDARKSWHTEIFGERVEESKSRGRE